MRLLLPEHRKGRVRRAIGMWQQLASRRASNWGITAAWACRSSDRSVLRARVDGLPDACSFQESVRRHKGAPRNRRSVGGNRFHRVPLIVLL